LAEAFQIDQPRWRGQIRPQLAIANHDLRAVA